ncbi:MAG: MBL fold metallo-hydrolase [Bacteroidota bacterium]|nr:MBL fold metallo-hydrolase [Bacteroidota bacterium]MDX5431257.1 MBL fold metallo-hydrolase [Bacteroidota bacterium]MDX5469996.1 MBL fold metallo-hydrolase [Bacteroidota bacterium]
MKVEQIYTGCLAQGAYYIQSGNEAAIIDPLREVQPYLDQAEKDGVQIKYIFETHFHADFVSGHIDLAKKTGAQIVYGPTDAPMGFEALIASDNQEFKIGDVTLKVLHTPGHTMESSCFLLFDENGKEHSIFTGDTLFIGDVGRPDLAQKVKAELTEEKLAEHLYHSLRNKIMTLPDHLLVYPAHGAGSACGKNMSKETSDLLGNQKKTNYALRPDMDIETFKKEVLTGLTPPPGYFPKNVMMNIQGYDAIDEVLERGTQALSPEAFEAAANETQALILDTRAPETFAKGFIPNSINIGIDGSFAPWVGTLIPDIKQEILLVTDAGREEEVVTRLARVGYDYAIGYLKGGVEAWEAAGKELDHIESIDAEELASRMEKGARLIDVRKKSEYDSEHIEGIENVPLDYINQNMASINPEKTYHVHCAGGYRSMIFCSILKSRGYDNVVNVKGGFAAIKKSEQFKLTEYVCPTTLL